MLNLYLKSRQCIAAFKISIPLQLPPSEQSAVITTKVIQTNGHVLMLHIDTVFAASIGKRNLRHSVDKGSITLLLSTHLKCFWLQMDLPVALHT